MVVHGERIQAKPATGELWLIKGKEPAATLLKGKRRMVTPIQTLVNLIGKLGGAGHLICIGDLLMLYKCLVVLKV